MFNWVKNIVKMLLELIKLRVQHRVTSIRLWFRKKITTVKDIITGEYKDKEALIQIQEVSNILNKAVKNDYFLPGDSVRFLQSSEPVLSKYSRKLKGKGLDASYIDSLLVSISDILYHNGKNINQREKLEQALNKNNTNYNDPLNVPGQITISGGKDTN